VLAGFVGDVLLLGRVLLLLLLLDGFFRVLVVVG